VTVMTLDLELPQLLVCAFTIVRCMDANGLGMLPWRASLCTSVNFHTSSPNICPTYRALRCCAIRLCPNAVGCKQLQVGYEVPWCCAPCQQQLRSSLHVRAGGAGLLAGGGVLEGVVGLGGWLVAMHACSRAREVCLEVCMHVVGVSGATIVYG
jgi:hypothetical protein